MNLNIKQAYLDYIGKMVDVVIDRPLNSKHPKHDLIYELNYGFVPNTIAADGEEIDAYVVGIDEPINSFNGRCIAVMHRENDDDDKLVVVPDGYNVSDDEIARKTFFQEKFFKSKVVRQII